MTSTIRIKDATIIEREHVVPLVHEVPEDGTITVFTREVMGDGGEGKPYLLFLQGGPGIEATRPTSPPSGWMTRALQDYRVLLIDQRGVGRSTPVGREIPGATPQEQADYLKHFRADSIVRDAELIRQELGVDRWSVLGQSFGGFCSMTYLSFAPEGLREAFITGGLAPIGRAADDVYSATWKRVLEKNRLYFERYSDDHARVRDIFARLDNEDIRLPNGDRLTSRRFRQSGHWLGDSAGFELLHNLVELPVGSSAFLHDAEAGMRFARNPIYATLHESSYGDGVVTNWSGARTMPAGFEELGFFSGEHVFPWMFEDFGWLQPHRAAAEILAKYQWPKAYDAAQLAVNEVPVAASIYVNDMYVDRFFAEETAAQIRGIRPWLTDEFEHNGLRADGDRVLSTLIDLIRDR